MYLKTIFLLILSVMFVGCSSGSSRTYEYDYDYDYDYDEWDDSEDYVGTREVELYDVDGDYGYGEDQRTGEQVEVYIDEWDGSDYGYGTDDDGNEVEFYYYN